MPDWKSHIRSRLASLRLSPAREREIAEELAQHLEDRWRELVAGGATPEDAAHTARTEFDGARLEALLGTLRQAHWHETAAAGSVARILVRQRPHRSASRHPGTEGNAQLHDRRAARAGAGHGRHDRDLLCRRRRRAPATAVSRPGPHRRGGSARGPGRRRAWGTTAIGARSNGEGARWHARRQASRAGCPGEHHRSGVSGLGRPATGL